MNKFNLKIAIRNLFKHKAFSFINIFGLAIGMGVCLVIYQYIQFELSFDKFHNNASDIFRITISEFKNDAKNSTQVTTPFGLGVGAKETIPEIRYSIRTHPQIFGAVVTNPEHDKPFLEEKMLFVDREFLEVFNFSLKQGSQEKVLTDKYNLVITEAMAEKYFGTGIDPVGKILKVTDGWADGDFIITGVLNPLPPNSHFVFDFLMPMQTLLEKGNYKGGNGWGRNNFVTYLTLDKNASIETVEDKLDQVILKNIGERLTTGGVELKTNLQSITDLHLNSDFLYDPVTNNGSLRNIQMISIIAVFILFLAWVNFINLTTARSIERAKEVGIRKIIGAMRKQLIFQFMLESFLLNLIAGILSILLAFILLPVLNNITGNELTFDIFNDPKFWLLFVTVNILGAIASGFYPAFVLSSFKPINTLYSNSIKNGSGIVLRKGLVVFQFAISVLLISGTFLIYKQVAYMKNQELGFDMQQVLVIKGPRIISDFKKLPTNLESFKVDVLNHPSIITACGSGTVPGKGHNALTPVRRIQATPEDNELGGVTYVDFDFFETYDFEFLSGRSFNPEIGTDQSGVIINEESVYAFDLGSPEKAIHEKLVIGNDTLKVLGVLKNYHWSSLRDAYSPYLFVPSERARRFLSFKINLSNISQSINDIQASYNLFFPDNPFEYFFLNDDFNRQYQNELQFGKLFGSFSILAITIGCLGLFALVSFSASLKTKEIGIRKILGAGIGNLMIMLSREYILLLVIANIVTIPIMFYTGQQWLHLYAFRIDLGVEIFLIPGMFLTAIALLTVSSKFYSTAKSNPINALRKE